MNFICIYLFLTLIITVGCVKKDLIQCYNCEGNNMKRHDIFCTNVYFLRTNPLEKERILRVCPEENFMCIKKIITDTQKNLQKIQRGCRKRVDDIGNPLRDGCIFYQNDSETTTVCLCSKDKCNRSNIIKPTMLLFINLLIHFIVLLI